MDYQDLTLVKRKKYLNIVGNYEHTEAKSVRELSHGRLLSETEIWKFDFFFPKITLPLAKQHYPKFHPDMFIFRRPVKIKTQA